MMSEYLLSRSREDIELALDAVYDSSVYNDFLNNPDPNNVDLLFLAYDSDLLAQALHLVECEWDQTVAQLSWNGRK